MHANCRIFVSSFAITIIYYPFLHEYPGVSKMVGDRILSFPSCSRDQKKHIEDLGQQARRESIVQ